MPLRRVRHVLTVAAFLAVTVVVLAARGEVRAGPAALTVMAENGGSPAAMEFQQGCSYSATLVDADTNAPIAGVTVTVLETGYSTRTDNRGRYTVPLPGPGTYTLRATLDGYEPLTRRIVLDATCRVVSSGIVGGGAGPAPTAPVATPPPTPSPAAAPPAPRAPGAQRFSGVVLVEGQPVSAGVTVASTVSDRTCAQTKTGRGGRYTVDVPAACGRAGVEVRFTVTPEFGAGWQMGSGVAFRGDTTVPFDITIDLRALTADAANVPWNGTWWATVVDLPVGICDAVSESSRRSVAEGLQQWIEANQSLGLSFRLVSNGDAACSDDPDMFGIGVIEDTLDEPKALAGTISVDADFNACSLQTPCWAYKSLIVINPDVFNRLPQGEKANVIAHEIGHALGLGHAVACTGGTIMWKDTECRFPLAAIGVDDIASLNNKAAAAGAVTAASTAIELRTTPDAPTAVDAARLQGPAAAFAARIDRGAIDWHTLAGAPIAGRGPLFGRVHAWLSGR